MAAEWGGSGINLVVLLAVLKLSGAIEISWPWVLSPILLTVLVLAVMVVLIEAGLPPFQH